MRFAALGFFLLCGALGARLAVAGYFFDLDSAAAIDRAANLVESAEYAERLAALDPERGPGALDCAIQWSPRSSAARIARGLERERSGDFTGAAGDLLQAAQVDHQYVPAWTLANYYFRRGDPQQFRKWARRAAELIPGDVDPLLVLCDRMDRGNALGMLPDQRKFDWAYFDFLIRRDRMEDAERVANTLAARHEAEDLRRLAAFTTRLIDTGRSAAAIATWRSLFPAATSPVNGDFRNPPSGQGFDWRTPPANGVTPAWTPGRMTFWLTGGQPEDCIFLEQPVPVKPGPYQLRFEYAGDLTGIRWTLQSAGSAELESHPAWTPAERKFLIQEDGIAWLRLLYRRHIGVPKAEGQIEIRRVQWEPLEPE